MKFTKEQAIENLKAALTNNGKKPLRMSERTLGNHAENLLNLVANDEMELDDFVNKVKPMIESVNSNIEHDLSESIREYKEKNPIQKVVDDPAKDKGDDTELSKLMKEIEDLKRKDAERETAATLKDKRAQIIKYLGDNNVKDKSWIDTALSMVSIAVEDDVETKGKALLEFYNKSISTPSPGVPGSPAPGAGDNGEPASFKAVREMRKRNAGIK